MRETRLVLFEGIPGSGKSTAAWRLNRVLGQVGVAHTWWYEEAKGHPRHTYGDWPSFDRMLGEIFSGEAARRRAVIDEVLERWGTMGESLARGEEVGILDGALFGHLTWTLFPAGAPNEETMGYVAEAERRLAAAKPCLIYMRQEDVGAGMRRIAERRGMGWIEGKAKQYEGLPYNRERGLKGPEGLVAYWQDYQQLADELFERSALAKRMVRVEPRDWEAGWREIAAFLELPEGATRGAAADAAAVGQLERYVGTYSYVRAGKEAECRVTLEEGRLYVDGLEDMWRHTPLVPMGDAGDAGDARFGVESYPIELAFERREDGAVHLARLNGPQPLWGTRAERLTKRSAPA